MPRTLAKTVTLMDPNSGEFVTHLKGTQPGDEVAERITNPAAWVPESEEDRRVGGTWPPDGGLEAMTEQEVFRAANSTSTSTATEGEEGDERTKKATGRFDPNLTYSAASIPQLRAMADERGIDVQGMNRKQQLVEALQEADARNA